MLPHVEVGLFIMSFLEHLPRPRMVGIVLTVLGVGLLVASIPFFRQLRDHPAQRQILLYLAITIVLVILTYLILFVLPTESAHFPQYALMAILVFPLTLRFGETLFWATLLGAIDEAYQYYFLAPERTDYYDFNDVITNLLGAALGLIYLWAFIKRPYYEQSLPWKKSPAFLTAMGILGLGVVLWLIGILSLYPSTDGAPSTILLFEVRPTTFWRALTPEISFHIVEPIEGLLIVGALFLMYQKLGKPQTAKGIWDQLILRIGKRTS